MKIQIIFMDMMIKIFLILGHFRRYLPISFQGYVILFKIFKGIWDIMDPTSRASQLYRFSWNATDLVWFV